MNQLDKKVLKNIPGFLELLPNKQMLFNNMKNAIKEAYELYGFLPQETPIIEKEEIILAKAGGETEKQIYTLKKGDNNLALRFDLTVPLARYVAVNNNELAFPYRRYQIGKVYRGEKPQRGRLREFYQCDVDIIGNETLDISHDAEIISLIGYTFNKLKFNNFNIKINNRKLLTGLFKELKLEDKSKQILIIIDKIEKIGNEKVKLMLKDIEVEEENIDKIINFLSISENNESNKNSENILNKLQKLNIKNEIFNKGLEELSNLITNLKMFKLNENNYSIDLSIARGLDYYTGTVYETVLTDYKEIGSICSGGRYNDLAENFINKKLPGVGMSIGLSRLFDGLDYLGYFNNQKESIAKVLVLPLTQNKEYAIDILNELRNNNIKAEIELSNKKIKNAINYADKLNIPYVIFIGEDEISNKTVNIKNIFTKEEYNLTKEEYLKIIK